MWCRATRQPAHSWMILTRAERRAMDELAAEIAQETKREIAAANAKVKEATRGR